MAQGVLSVMQGGDFLSGSVSATLGSLGVSGFGAVVGEFSKSAGGVVIAGAISGGIGAELSGGNFWQGAVTGGIVAGLNSAMHKVSSYLEKDNNPPKKKENNIDEKLKKIKAGTNVASSLEIIDAIDESLSPKNRKILGKHGGKTAGFIAAGGEVIYNYTEYDNGRISGYRFTYRLGKTSTTIIVGSKIAGPKGVALGVFLGAGFDIVEKAWDSFITEFTYKMNEFQNNINYNIMRAKHGAF